MTSPAIPPVLTVTLNPAIDLNLTVADWPREDLARAVSTRRAAGGKGINVSRVLAELGVASTAFCLVGGPDAYVFESLLAEAPFEVKPVRVSGPTRTNVTITAERGGRSIKVNQPGPAITPTEWRRIKAEMKPLFEGRQWVVFSGALPPGAPSETYARLVRLARRCGARVALDCAGPSLLKALPARPDMIKPNRAELGETIGLPCRTRRQIVQAARRLQEEGAGLIIVSHGGGECLALGREEVWSARPPRIQAGNPMGAGDSLVAGLLAGLIQGLSLPEALRLGAACGAASAASPDTVLARRPQIKSLNSLMVQSKRIRIKP